MTRSNSNPATLIIICAAVIFAIITITFSSLDPALGQTNTSGNVTLVTAADPPLITAQQVSNAVEEVPGLVDQVDTNSTTNALIGTVVTALGGYVTTKFLKDRKDKAKVEEYSSETDKTIFNHVMDNYNDFANYCKIRRKYLTLLADPANATKPEAELLNAIADPVSKKTYMQIEAEYLDDVIGWNVEYYGSPSTDPNITCPDPKNKLARTMTDIKKLSVPSTTPATT